MILTNKIVHNELRIGDEIVHPTDLHTVVITVGEKVQLLGFTPNTTMTSGQAAIIRKQNGTIRWIDSSFIGPL